VQADDGDGELRWHQNASDRGDCRASACRTFIAQRHQTVGLDAVVTGGMWCSDVGLLAS
jgi:hypothetical protein